MPSFKKLSVNIVTPSGSLSALHQEFSCQHQQPLCESYILSKADTPFWVSIIPDCNFFQKKPCHSHRNCSYSSGRLVRNKGEHVIDLTQDDPEEEWHLLAEVFLDNQSTAETSAIVYLPWHGKAKERVIRGRIAATSDGRTVERQWLFKDVSLEQSLEGLSVVDKDVDGDFAVTDVREPAGSHHSEDVLVESMQNLGGKGKGKEKQPSDTGYIKIVFTKIIITGFCIDVDYTPKFTENDELGKVAGSIGDAGHTAGFGRSNDVRFSATRKSYRPYPMEREAYATFIFHYRGKKQMRKLGFLDAPEASCKKLDKLVPFLIPLPISGNHKAQKTWEKSKPRFCPSGLISSTSSEESTKDVAPGSSQVLKRTLSEASRSDKDQAVARESSSSKGSRGSSESSDESDSETAPTPAPTIADITNPLSLVDVECQEGDGLVISAVAKFEISAPVTREGDVRDLRGDETTDTSESDKGYEGDTEAQKVSKGVWRISSPEEVEEVKELVQRLHLVKLKRSRIDETDDGDGETGEWKGAGVKVQSHRQTKRARRRTNSGDSV